jgi:hypothetical protein
MSEKTFGKIGGTWVNVPRATRHHFAFLGGGETRVPPTTHKLPRSRTRISCVCGVSQRTQHTPREYRRRAVTHRPPVARATVWQK